VAAVAVDYLIYLTDLARVNSLTATYPTGIQIPPTAAAATFGVPTPGQGSGNLNNTGGIVVFPQDSIGSLPTSLASAFGTETFSVTYPDTNPPGGGFPDPYPLTLSCYWVGHFAYTGGVNTLNPPGNTPRYCGKRHWICGFEVPTLGEGGSGQGTMEVRDASRTPDGMGYAYRNENNSANRTFTKPANTRISWERFYVRLRTLPTGGDDNIWSALGSVDAGKALLLNVNTTGTLQAYDKGNAAYPGHSLGTTGVLTTNTWYRIDLRIQFFTSAFTNSVQLDLYLNGVKQFSGQGSNPSTEVHSSSSLGEDVSATAHGLECDFDDWISANEVNITNANGATTVYPGIDLTTGSHVVAVHPVGFGTGHQSANWAGVGAGSTAGNYQEIDNIDDALTTFIGLTSTTPSAIIQANTDYVTQQSGAVAATVSVRAPTTPGSMTLQLNSLPSVTVASGGNWQPAGNIYSVADGATVDSLPSISPFQMTFTSNSGAGTTIVTGLIGSVEFAGAWGPEDTVNALPGSFDTRVGIHNAPYPLIKPNHDHVAPISAVRVASGIYVGNNIGQDLFEKISAHWYWVRDITSGNYVDGGWWFSSMQVGHGQVTQKLRHQAMTRASWDTAFNAKLEINGSDTQTDSGTQTYQWVAVSDPGMRNMINGAFSHKASLASAVNNLVDSAFSPDAMFLMQEDFSSGSLGAYFKGPGNVTNHACGTDSSGDNANIASMTAGSITSLTAIHTDTPGTAYSVWRKNDGTGVAQWMDIITYTGNGAGNRNITVSLNGMSPLFAMVFDHSGGAYFRDPSHSGANSAKINVGNTTTAIIAGAANQITVHSNINVLNIVYEVFVIGGGTTAWTNPSIGFFTPAGEAKRATTGPWAADPVQTIIAPVSLVSNNQWQVQRVDIGPRDEETL